MLDDKKEFLVTRGFKFPIFPTEEQKILLSNTFGSTRYIFNHFVDWNKKEMDKHKESPYFYPKPTSSGFKMILMLTKMKKDEDTKWLSNVSSVALKQTLLHLSTSLIGAINGRKNFPKFKSKSGKQSFTLAENAYTLSNKILTIAKSTTPIDVKWTRDLPTGAKLGNIIISKTSSDKYFVSITCTYSPKKIIGSHILGIDLGITDLATFSDGTTIANLRTFLHYEKKIRTLNKKYSKSKEGSKNKEKRRLRLAIVHEKMANIRKDYIHKLTTKLVSENQAIAMESLNIKNMVKNRKLSKHILDAGWGMFRRFLEYKTISSQHNTLILADPFFPSTQRCSLCLRKPKEKLKLNTRQWKCFNCGNIHQRDINAALNLEILARETLKLNSKSELSGKIYLAPRYINLV